MQADALARLARGRFGRATRKVVQGKAKRGLFHGRHIQFGNKISESAHKTRRSWKPNVQRKRLRSDALGRDISIRVTCKALRCVDKAGGLDEYLLRTPPHRLGEGLVLELREQVMAARAAAADGAARV